MMLGPIEDGQDFSPRGAENDGIIVRPIGPVLQFAAVMDSEGSDYRRTNVIAIYVGLRCITLVAGYA